MVIGIDASRANQAQRTGTEWYSFYLIKHLAKIIGPEHQVFLYTRETLKDDLCSQLPAHFIPKVLGWPPKFLWTQIRLSLHMLFHKPDILFVPAHTIPLIHPKKTVVTVHDIGFEKLKELYNFTSIGPNSGVIKKILSLAVKILTLGKYNNNELDYHRWAMRFAVKQAYHILTISDFSKKEIIDFFKIPASKITRIYISCDETLHRITDQETISSALTKYHITPPYIVFVGRLEQKKNLPRLIDAWNIVKTQSKISHKLVLAGSHGFQYDSIQNKIKQFDLRSSIVETGYIDSTDMATLISAADAYILPSLYEGFGIPILEAFSCQTPLLCSKIASIPEIAKNAALYFDPYDFQDMARVIIRFLLQPSLDSDLTQRGTTRRHDFSWEKCAAETWKVLTHLE